MKIAQITLYLGIAAVITSTRAATIPTLDVEAACRSNQAVVMGQDTVANCVKFELQYPLAALKASNVPQPTVDACASEARATGVAYDDMVICIERRVGHPLCSPDEAGCK